MCGGGTAAATAGSVFAALASVALVTVGITIVIVIIVSSLSRSLTIMGREFGAHQEREPMLSWLHWLYWEKCEGCGVRHGN
jgi:glycerol-3-phosphate acyltransferase PlsY